MTMDAAAEASLPRGRLARLRAAASDPGSLRLWTAVANDGIIATAGILEGFAGAGANDRSLLVVAIIATVAGMLAAGGIEWSQAATEREAQQTAAAAEAQELARDPAAEAAELAEHYRSRGVEPALAAEVARQLMAHDALAAQLETEHGIRHVMSAAETLSTGVGAVVAYAIGAVIPLLITALVPQRAETWAIVVAVLVSLVVTSIVGARSGRTNVVRTLARTLAVGAGTLIVSYLVGQLIT
ncbi:VIT1/CCC1 transporter family protein [Gryllotalpicola protaetiae]|uniref:VIT family protein n=1 Tax=Gryllotalpicola protaetiae TaxID=2419771 RepID=A0A387BMS6_9MICO|nr:hypothetical protein D7I44_01470 [Gryllotalpicola protaetiae]